ncbi:MAG: PAS domain S-box protein, partial [Thermoplasmata archaeon]
MIEILMVDDEEAFLDQAKIFLEKSKDEFQVSTVETVDDALTHLEQDRYDIIVSDYMMPVKNGLDFLEIVRKERDSDIPFIIFTGKGREEVAIEALNLGADRYIQKGGSPTSQYGVLADAIRQEHEHFQSEKKYRTVVGSSHDAIYIYKGNEFLFVNDQAVETTGYSKEELYDMNMWDLLHPEDKEMVRKREERRVKGEDVPSKYEARLETKKGEVKHLQFTVGSIGFEDQKAFLGSARDITELKKAYEEREEYIEELQFLNEVMLDVARMENIDEICDYIAEKIYSLNQENHVLVSLYDRNIEAIQVRSIAGFGEYQQMIEDQFVGGEEKMTFDPEVLDDWEEIYSSGNLESMPEGLYSIVKGVLSKEEAKELEELIGVEEVYYVGFALDKKPYGGISIFKPEEGEPRFKSAIETIASHLSLILQRKQDERRQRLSDFSLEQASLEIYWITPEGKFIFTNEIVSEKLGYSKDELQDMYVWDLDPDFEKDIRREHWERLKEEKVFSFESEHETKDGEIYPVEVTSNYLEFDGREYEFAFAEDISERKEAERKIKESEEKYRSLFNSIHDAILVTDTERNIIDCNPAFTDIFGYELDEIEGKKTEYVYHDVEQFEEMGEEIREHIGEIDFYYTIDYEKKSGDVFPGETKVFYLRDDEGEITGFIGVIRDITEKEKKEKELRDERNFIEQITETSPVCITKVDKDGNITYANDKAEDVLGLSKSEIKGRTYHDVDWKITDYDGGPFDKEELPFNLVKEKGEAVYDVRHAIEWPDGERKLLSINASPLYDEEGNFDGMVATIQNVTEKVEKKRELKETKNRLSEIIEGVSVPIFVIDDEHTVTHWNRALEELCGLSKDEMIGTKDPWRAFYAEERPVLADLVVEDGSKEKMEEHYGDNVQEAPLLQDTYRGEYLFTDMGKNGVWMYFTASPIKDSNGNVIGAIETLQDVTERKKTELDLREKERAIKNSINGIAITDLDGTISYVNKALVEMFGYDMEEDILGEDTLKYFYDEEKAAEAIGELLDEGEWQGELKAVKKDGELITVYLSANLILDEDGNPTGLLGTMIDITERKEAEQELEEVKERYDAIFERSMDAVYIHDLEGNILDVNQATFELLGYEKGDLEDLKFTDILPEDHLEKAFETLEEVMETGSQDELTTFEVKAENGERILIETKSSLIYKDGEPYAVLGIGRDITER